MDWFKQEVSSFDFEYLSDIKLRLKMFFSFLVPMFSPKANMDFLYQPHSHMYVQ